MFRGRLFYVCSLILFVLAVTRCGDSKREMATADYHPRFVLGNNAPAEAGKFPMLFFFTSAPETSFPAAMCTGVAITSKTVLTAVHCIPSSGNYWVGISTTPETLYLNGTLVTKPAVYKASVFTLGSFSGLPGEDGVAGVVFEAAVPGLTPVSLASVSPKPSDTIQYLGHSANDKTLAFKIDTGEDFSFNLFKFWGNPSRSLRSGKNRIESVDGNRITTSARFYSNHPIFNDRPPELGPDCVHMENDGKEFPGVYLPGDSGGPVLSEKGHLIGLILSYNVVYFRKNKNEIAFPLRDHSGSNSLPGPFCVEPTVANNFGKNYIAIIKNFSFSLNLCAESTREAIATKLKDLSKLDADLNNINASPCLPAAPTDLRAKPISGHQIDLKWTTDSGSGAFEIYRSKTENGVFTEVGCSDSSSYSDFEVSPLTSYYYKVRKINTAGSSEFSNLASATTLLSGDITLDAKVLSVTKAKLDWRDSANPYPKDGYQIERVWGSQFYSFSTPTIFKVAPEPLSMEDKELEACRDYTYRARSYKGSTFSSYSNEKTVSTKVIPKAPTGFNGTISGDKLTLTWNADGLGTEFKVYQAWSQSYSGNPGDYSDVYAPTISSDKTSVQLSTSGFTLRECYKLRAFTSCPNSSENSDYSQVKCFEFPPWTPSIKATPKSTASIEISWNYRSDSDYAGATFKIERAEGAGPLHLLATVGPAPGGSYSIEPKSQGGDTRKYLDEGPSTGKYQYRVTAIVGGHESKPSNVASFTFPPDPPPPTSVSADGEDTSTMKVSWQYPKNEEGVFFQIRANEFGKSPPEYRTLSIFDWKQNPPGTFTYYQGGLEPDTQYVFQIRASRDVGQGISIYSQSAVSSGWTLPKPPPTPSSITAEAKQNAPTIEVKWAEVPEAHGYVLTKTISGIDGTFATLMRKGETSTRETNLSYGTTYTYTVRAFKNDGTFTYRVYSPESYSVSATTIKTPPVNLPKQGTVSISLPSSGKVTGPGINCGLGKNDCTFTGEYGTQVALSYQPGPDYSAGGWARNEAEVKTSDPSKFNFSIDEPWTLVTAFFKGSGSDSVPIVLRVIPSGLGLISLRAGDKLINCKTECQGYVPKGALTLTAVGNLGVIFKDWVLPSPNTCSSSYCSVQLIASGSEIRATFTAIQAPVVPEPEPSVIPIAGIVIPGTGNHPIDKCQVPGIPAQPLPTGMCLFFNGLVTECNASIQASASTSSGTSSTFHPALLDSNALTITGFYSDILGNCPDTAGLTYFENIIKQNPDPVAIAKVFLTSAAKQGKDIGKFYQSFLGRPADVAGLAYWTSVLRSGISITQLPPLFFASPEFNSRWSSPEDYVSYLYGAHLGKKRGAEAFFVNVLKNKQGTRADVERVIRTSREAQALLLTTAYRNFVRRDPSNEDIDYWISVMSVNQMSLEEVLARILGSNEYRSFVNRAVR